MKHVAIFLYAFYSLAHLLNKNPLKSATWENYRGFSYVTAKLHVFISEPAECTHTFLGRGRFHKGLELGVFHRDFFLLNVIASGGLYTLIYVRYFDSLDWRWADLTHTH